MKDRFWMVGEIRFDENGNELYSEFQEKINELIGIVKRLGVIRSVRYPGLFGGVRVTVCRIDFKHPVILKTLRKMDIVIKRGTITFEEQANDSRLIKHPKSSRGVEDLELNRMLKKGFVEPPPLEHWTPRMRISTRMTIRVFD